MKKFITEFMKKWAERIGNNLDNATPQDLADVFCTVFLALDSNGHKFPMPTNQLVEGFMTESGKRFGWSAEFTSEAIHLCHDRL